MIQIQNLSVLALLLLIAVFLASIYPPLASFDSYFHLAIGREVAATGQIPQIDTFTFVGQGKEWISNEWLSGLLFYLTYLNFQEAGILVLRVILGLATLSFLILILNLQKIRFPLKIATILLVALTLSLRMLDRPEMISFLFLALLIYLLARYQQKPQLLVLTPIVPIFILWPNIQGYAPIGLAVVAYGILRIILLAQKPHQPLLAALKDQKWPILVFALSSLVALLQFKRFLYVLFLNPELFSYVSEVQSVADKLAKIKYSLVTSIPLDLYILFLFATASLISFYLAKKQLPGAIKLLDISFVLALGFLAFKYARTLPLFVLLASPFVAYNLNDYLTTKKRFLIILILLISLLMTYSIYQKKIFGERHYTLQVLDKSGQVKVATSYTWKERRPTKALDFIAKNLAPQRIITSVNWSNQTIWQLQGKNKVMVDIIYEKQSSQSYQDYRNLASGQGPTEAILAKYNPDIIINSQPLNLVEKFEASITKLPDWRLVYVDDVAAVYAKASLAKDLALTALHPEAASEIKFKAEEKDLAKSQLQRLLTANPQNSFATYQLILASLIDKNYQEVEQLTRQSIALFPKDPNFYLLLAKIKAAAGTCLEVQKLTAKVKPLAKGYFYLKNQAKALENNCPI